MSDTITHKLAVRRVANWLRGRRNCGVVMAELKTQNTECPDCIGWHGAGGSILVECKISRSDFFADSKKIFRWDEDQGMGDLRYFATPPKLVQPDEVPEGWGLLEIREHGIYEIKEPVFKHANKQCEVKMLMSAIRRLEISTAVFVREEPPLENNSPSRANCVEEGNQNEVGS